MLTLPLTTTGNIQIARDHLDRERRYIASTQVQVVSSSNQKPNFQLLTWMSADGAQDIVGGRLNATLSVYPNATVIEAAGLNQEHVRPLPWRNVSVILRGPNLQTAPSNVAILSNGNALVSIDLDHQAVSIINGALENPGLTPLSAEWAGVVDLQFPALSVRASASRTEIRSRLQQLSATEQRNSLSSIVTANIQIHVEAGADSRAEQLIRDWCIHEITRRFDNESDLFVEVNAADIVEWPISIQSTLTLDSADQTNATSLVLSDSELGTERETLVRVLADFGQAVHRVDVEIEDDSSTHQLAFTNTQSQKLSELNSFLSWRWRANLGNGKVTSWSDWHNQSSAQNLLIPVSLPASQSLEIVASRLDFDKRWAKVIVKFTHDSGIEPVVLDRHNLMAALTVNDTVFTGLTAQLEFITHNGQILVRQVSLGSDKTILVLDDPLAKNALNVTLIPVGTGWRDVAKAMIDLRFEEGEDRWRGTRALDSINATAQWSAPRKHQSTKSYQWRSHTSYTDGRFETSEWKQSTSSLLSIRLDAPQRREIQIIAVYLKPGEQVVVHLEMDDAQWSATLVDSTPAKIELPPGEFKWFAQWQLGQDQIRSETTSSSANVIVLPRSPDPNI